MVNKGSLFSHMFYMQQIMQQFHRFLVVTSIKIRASCGLLTHVSRPFFIFTGFPGQAFVLAKLFQEGIMSCSAGLVHLSG